VEIKGGATLGEIEEKVDNFQAFWKEFGFSPDEPLTSTLKSLAAKRGFEILKVREYVSSHRKPQGFCFWQPSTAFRVIKEGRAAYRREITFNWGKIFALEVGRFL